MVQSREQKADFPATTNDIQEMGRQSHNGHADNSTLSTLQKEILLYLEQGYTKHEAAKELRMSVHTFDSYLREIYRIENVHTMTAAVAKAIREKMI